MCETLKASVVPIVFDYRQNELRTKTEEALTLAETGAQLAPSRVHANRLPRIGALKNVADDFPGFAPASIIAVAQAQTETIAGQLGHVDTYENKATNVLWCGILYPSAFRFMTCRCVGCIIKPEKRLVL